MTLRLQNLTVDCADPAALATFWEAVLGWPQHHEGDEEYWLEPPGGGMDLLFIRVPEAKSGKNRLHLDLRPDDQDAEVRRLEELGARRTSIGQGPEVTWVVMADPEGNEFCVLRALPPE